MAAAVSPVAASMDASATTNAPALKSALGKWSPSVAGAALACASPVASTSAAASPATVVAAAVSMNAPVAVKAPMLKSALKKWSP